MGGMMTSRDKDRHLNEITCAVEGSLAAVSPIVASWTRSSRLHALSPSCVLVPERLEEFALHHEREALGRLIQVAHPSLDQIFDLVGHAGCTVVMANHKGVILERRGSAADDGLFEILGLGLGANWSEKSQGTNAIGTALVERRAIVIYRDQHFMTRNTILSCMTAPIHDEFGALAAVIDVSTCKPDLSEGFARIICSLAVDAAEKIEIRNFNRAFAGHRIVMLPEKLAHGPAPVAIDRHDLIIGASHAARRALGLFHCERQLNIPAPEVMENCQPGSDTLDRAERSVLLRNMERNAQNVTHTAKALGISRATLYRKLAQHGIVAEPELHRSK